MYKGIDLTLDIYEQIERIVKMIAKYKHISFEEAYLLFSQSHTYWCLQNPATAMWGESDGFVFDEYLRETNEGQKQVV